MSLHATSLACVVLLDFLMLFILFGVKIKESFSIICHLCDLCVGRRLVENQRLGPFPAHTVIVCRSPSAAHHVAIKGLYVSSFLSSSRRCFPFSANVKSISHAIRVQRRTHVSSFFIEEKKKKQTSSFFSSFFFPCHTFHAAPVRRNK